MRSRVDDSIDVATLTTEKLQAYRLELVEDAERISRQLRDRPNGAPDWREKATFAMRCRRRAVQRCEEELGRRRRSEGQKFARSLERAFILVAKRDLEDTDFREMWDEAVAVAQGREPWPKVEAPQELCNAESPLRDGADRQDPAPSGQPEQAG